MKKSIAQYQLEDSIRGINAIWVGHVLIVFFYLLGGLTGSFSSPHFWFSLITAFIFLGRKVFYNWKDLNINVSLVAVYLISFILEFGIFGLPALLMEMAGGKGFMLELMVAMIPGLYIGIRFMLLIPLIQLVVRQKQYLAKAV